MPTDLWRFALNLYAQPGVTAACLRLQDKGADVCLLLCGAWLEQRGLTCTAARVQQLTALAGPWQAAVIGPLRRLRQDWRAAALADTQLQGLREQIKGLELEAERELLRRLEQTVLSWPACEAQHHCSTRTGNLSGPACEVQRTPDAWLERLAPSVGVEVRTAAAPDSGLDADSGADADQDYRDTLQLLRVAIPTA